MAKFVKMWVERFVKLRFNIDFKINDTNCNDKMTMLIEIC